MSLPAKSKPSIGGIPTSIRMLDEWFRRGDLRFVRDHVRVFGEEFRQSKIPSDIEFIEDVCRKLERASAFELEHGVGSFLDLNDSHVQRSMDGRSESYTAQELENARLAQAQRGEFLKTLGCLTEAPQDGSRPR